WRFPESVPKHTFSRSHPLKDDGRGYDGRHQVSVTDEPNSRDPVRLPSRKAVTALDPRPGMCAPTTTVYPIRINLVDRVCVVLLLLLKEHTRDSKQPSPEGEPEKPLVRPPRWSLRGS